MVKGNLVNRKRLTVKVWTENTGLKYRSGLSEKKNIVSVMNLQKYSVLYNLSSYPSKHGLPLELGEPSSIFFRWWTVPVGYKPHQWRVGASGFNLEGRMICPYRMERKATVSLQSNDLIDEETGVCRNISTVESIIYKSARCVKKECAAWQWGRCRRK